MNYLAAAALAGSHVIWLASDMDAVPAIQIGDPDLRSYEIHGIDPGQEFPSGTIRLRGALRMSYALGEPVKPVTDW